MTVGTLVYTSDGKSVRIDFCSSLEIWKLVRGSFELWLRSLFYRPNTENEQQVARGHLAR